MGTCEMCGSSGDLKKTKVEGTTLKLCEDCQEVGEVVDTGGPKKKSRGKTGSRPSPDIQEEIVPGYGSTVKEARESRDLSVSDLADSLKEKESVVRRVESGKLKPDRGLARKFEKELGVELYEKVSAGTEENMDSTGSSGETTIGDVADVRKR